MLPRGDPHLRSFFAVFVFVFVLVLVRTHDDQRHVAPLDAVADDLDVGERRGRGVLDDPLVAGVGIRGKVRVEHLVRGGRVGDRELTGFGVVGGGDPHPAVFVVEQR
jgi:hypothetical protein